MQRIAFIFLMFIACTMASARAETADMYTVHGIMVDASNPDPSAARDEAIAQGARKGLVQLLKNLGGGKPVPPVSDRQAGQLVKDFEVESERVSAQRYTATLTYRFRGESVKALMGEAGASISASLDKSPAVLVIPVYRAATGDLLWQDANPWRTAWKGATNQNGLVPVVVPAGDAFDQQQLAATDLGNPDKLAGMAQHYNVPQVLVIYASAVSPTGEPDKGLKLKVVGNNTQNGFKSPGAPTVDAVLAKGVTTTLTQLDTMWRQHLGKGAGNALTPPAVPPAPAEPDLSVPPTGNAFTLNAPLAGPGDWPTLRTKLEHLAGVQRVELRSLTRDGAIMQIYLDGDEAKLSQTLASARLTLGTPHTVSPDESDLATMVPASGPAAGLVYPLTGGANYQ